MPINAVRRGKSIGSGKPEDGQLVAPRAYGLTIIESSFGNMLACLQCSCQRRLSLIKIAFFRLHAVGQAQMKTGIRIIVFWGGIGLELADCHVNRFLKRVFVDRAFLFFILRDLQP